MINENELRIGSYLIDTDTGRLGIVRTISNRKITLKLEHSTIWQHIIEYSPIPLTEDILLKCGFGGSNETIFTKMDIGPIYFSRPYVGAKHYLVKAISGDKITSVKHLHQLQNLYFALTGKEIKINL